MKVFSGRNVNEVFYPAMMGFQVTADIDARDSRNGPVLEYIQPVSSVYRHPDECVLFDTARDANPFFHFFEALWMLAGRNDVAFPAHFAKQIAEYSDDNETLNGAYGYRWRHSSSFDQLEVVIDTLRNYPDTRRAVLQMWTRSDLVHFNSKDLPCNTAVYFKIRQGRLNMMVTNRSNDAIWGCYGANAVHFAFLQMYVASSLGVPIGHYTQVSDSLHIYPALQVTKRVVNGLTPPRHMYRYGEVYPVTLFSEPDAKELFDADLKRFFSSWDDGGPNAALDRAYLTPFFEQVAVPLLAAHTDYKRGANGVAELEGVHHTYRFDFHASAIEWLERRNK